TYFYLDDPARERGYYPYLQQGLGRLAREAGVRRIRVTVPSAGMVRVEYGNLKEGPLARLMDGLYFRYFVSAIRRIDVGGALVLRRLLLGGYRPIGFSSIRQVVRHRYMLTMEMELLVDEFFG